MSTIVNATKKQGSLIIEVCPGSGSDCEHDHPKKVTGSRGRVEDNNYEETYDTASHAVIPFRLTDGAYDLNEDRAAELALKQVDDQVEERYGTGEAHTTLIGRSSDRR